MIEFTFIDACDILIVAAILYQLYRLLKGTQGMQVFTAVLAFTVLWFLVSYVFQMELLGSIMGGVVNVGGILLIVLFQDEIRSFISGLGKHNPNGLYARFKRLFTGKQSSVAEATSTEIVQAAAACSKTKTGLLIVIQNAADLTQYWRTGERIEARIKSRLIENIFFKNTPLHDGALIIVNDRIKAAGCILPISHKTDLPKHLGLRHRAALGISEKTDATVIIVSEETGKISVAEGGQFHLGISPEELHSFLTLHEQA